MGPLRTLLPTLLLAVAASLALSACGSGESADLLPGGTADEITANLEQVRERSEEGDCVGAEDAVATVRLQIVDLGGVDAKLKAALSEGAERLEEVVGQCEEAEPEETEPSPETAVEPEEEVEQDEKKKPKPEKAEKEPEVAEEATEGPEGPTLPPQSNGKGEEKGQGGGPATEETEPEPPSGGVGPGTAVEGE
ncbi:MAG TPA: hypothetical protein VFJ99_00525 [Solirubrobacterales bacterium]|nr:hypothetical protein [Solirubrobacterales bacterium]